ncbi:MAG: alpha-(1-_3)-arabinofuranosyltransferase domain-containing protein, partial [Acidimicrobiales bacterium]
MEYTALAVLALIPMLASQPGTVVDDTKTYLYLDPGRYVRQAASLWDPGVGLGTVTHENIGYLLPMGPFYWAAAELHVPLWIAQRLWMAALLFAAGAGALYLCRTVGLTGPGRCIAALGFMFTPYVLQYAGRISVILMPWAGLPWMVAFVILALRRGGWRYPALFALVVALVSGINASSILYVGIAPALWLPYAVLVAREATWRRAWGVAWKVGLLSALVSLWWAVGLQVEAAYGINVLKYTETVHATSGTSLASEIVRGLGYWYFYGSDRVGAWTQTSVGYTQSLWLIGASFVVPALAFAAAAFARWRYRGYFVLLTVVGMVLAVGPNPYADPSAVGSLLKAIMVDTTAGLAMRSTDRASPLVVLSLAMFLGAAVSAVTARLPRAGLAVGGLAAGAVLAASTPLWTGGIVADGFTQPAAPPLYVRQAAAALNRSHPGTRVYALPGNNFAAYRWGDTIDTVYPGLMTRPFVTHEQQIMGSLATADLLQAVDTPLQDGTMDWNTLGPVSSLMSAGDVLVQYDQAYERYDTPIPQQLAQDLSVTPPGLSNPVGYGRPTPNVSLLPHFDEATLARPPNQGWPAPLTTYSVVHPRPIVRAESTSHPLVIAGDASGIVNAASVGLLASNPTILYAGSLDLDHSLQKATLAAPADLVVTDTNRKQGYRWNSLNENTGYTETAAQGPDTSDPTDAPINLFPGAPADAQTTARLLGVSAVAASSYGSSITYFPEDRPAAALDGNPQTAWLDDSFGQQLGQWWQVSLDQARTVGSVRLVQPQTGDPDRWITKVTLTFDGGHAISVPLGPSSRTPAGQVVTFPTRTFTTLRLTVAGVGNSDLQTPVPSRSSVGFAEVGIPGIAADETIAMPEDLLRAAGPASASDRLSLVMTRLRSSGTPPRSDPETSLARSFWLPSPRTFSVTGTARISPLIPDDQIDRLVGRSGPPGAAVTAYSLGRLPGDLRAGAAATLDGDPSTLWEPGFGQSHQAGQWLQYKLPRPVTFDHLDLQVAADGQHSVPTRVTVSADSGSAAVTLPPVADGAVPGSVVDVPVTFPSLTGQSIRVTVDDVRIEDTTNYRSQTPIAMPIGIAEVGIPGVQAGTLPVSIPTSCRNDLLSVDGRPLWVSITGLTSTALSREPLTISLCGPDAGGLALGTGPHTLHSTLGQVSGFDIDQLAMDSAPGGGAMPLATATSLQSPPVTAAPRVTVQNQTATTVHLTMSGVTHASEQSGVDLVLGESINPGWTATTAGGRSLGKPELIDGYANGWRLDPSDLPPGAHDGTISVVLRWQPQRRVDLALIVSTLAILVCLALVVGPRARERRRAGRERRRAGREDGSAMRQPVPAASRRTTATERSTPADTPAVATMDTSADISADSSPGAPALIRPFRADGPPAPLWVALVTGVVTGAVAAAIAMPAAGLAVGVASAVVLLVPRLRIVLGLVAVGGIVAAGVYTVVHQATFDVLPGGSWPLSFGAAGRLAWAAVVFLGADAVVEAVLGRRTAGRDVVGAEGDPPSSAATRGPGSDPN